MELEDRRVALFGAAGAIGQSIAAALHQAGRPYRVVGRSRAPLIQSFGRDPLAEIVTWNPDDPESVRAAARGIDTIVYLVGVNYWQFELHPQLIAKTLAGAVAEGVERFLLIGTVYPYGRARTDRVREDHPREPHTFKGKMRKAQEDLLLEADAAGRIKGAVLRLPDFYGPNVDKSFLQSAFVAAATGSAANLVGPLDRPHEFVFVPDVGPVVVRLAATPGAWGPVAPPALPGFIANTSPSAPSPRVGTRLLVGPPLGGLPWHRSDRFPRSTQEPALGSRRLCAGHHPASKQAVHRACPRPTTGAWFRWRPYAFDTLPTVHLRSSSQHSPDGFHPAFSRERSPPRPLGRSSFRWFGP